MAIDHQGAAGQVGTASQARKLYPYLHRTRPQPGSHHLVEMPGHVIGYLGAAGHHHPEAAGVKALKLNKERMLIRKRLRAGELTLDQAIGLDGEAAAA
jgi:hypothetical protein